MSARFVVPDSDSVSKLLGIVFGDEISVAENESSGIESKNVATFIDREDNLVAVCACDQPFVGFSGGALSMMPVGAIEDMIQSGDMSESLLDNFYEVMNICSKLMMDDSSDHLRLDKTVSSDEISDEISALASQGTHAGFSLDIPRYGKGAMDFYIA